MSSGIDNNIQKLEELKKQLNGWRYGTLGVSFAIVIVCVLMINGAVRGLINPGPKQDAYIENLSSQLQNDVLPIVSDMAGQTLSEVQPQITAAFSKLNESLPELAQATMTELNALEHNLPKRGESVLDKSLGTVLRSKADEFQRIFPEATPEQIEKLLVSLADQGSGQAVIAADKLFGRHQEAIARINENIEKIHRLERGAIAGLNPDWEMGLLILDIFRTDLEELRPDKSNQLAVQERTDKTKVALKEAK